MEATEWECEARAMQGPLGTGEMQGSLINKFVALNKKSNDWEYANFIVLHKSVNFGLNEERIINSIGTPSEIVRFEGYDDYVLYIWDKNIMNHIDGVKDETK